MTNFSTLNVNSNCDVSTIFAGGGPPDAGAKVVVGGKQLIPSPFVNLTLEKYKVGDYTIGGVLKLTLNGVVTGSSFNEVVSTGAGGATGLKDILEIGQKKGCVDVLIECTNKLIDGYGRVVNVSMNEGNMPTWVNMAPYTIEIELYDNDISLPDRAPVLPDEISTNNALNNLMLKNISENLSLNINDESFNWATPPTSISMGQDSLSGWGNRHIAVNFNINAIGVAGCGSGSNSAKKYGMSAVEQYMINRIQDLRNMNLSVFDDSPSAEIETALQGYSNGTSYLDFRNIDINPIENSITLNGQIIYRPSGCNYNNVFTTMNIEQNIDPEGTTFTINGNIQGLIDVQYDELIKLSPNKFTSCNLNEKITNAETFLSKFAKLDNLISLASHYYKDGLIDENQKGYLEDNCPSSAGAGGDPCSSASPSPSPTTLELCDLRLSSSQINRNLPEGIINFTFVLSNKANCNILGAKKVDVEVTHDIPHDNIVEILIPGRGDKGVITQNLCCKSVEKYDASVNIVLNRNNCNNSMPSGTLANLRTCAEQILKDKLDPSVVDCWFITNHQEADGNNSYRLNKTYVKPSC